jgi:predicted nucleic acid-binding protein
MAATIALDTTVLSHLARYEASVTATFTSWLSAGNGVVIWGALARTGKTRRMDADILIAASALRGGYEVATRNAKDFLRIVDVRPKLVVRIW